VFEIGVPIEDVEHDEGGRKDDARDLVYLRDRVERLLRVVHGASDATLAAALLHIVGQTRQGVLGAHGLQSGRGRGRPADAVAVVDVVGLEAIRRHRRPPPSSSVLLGVEEGPRVGVVVENARLEKANDFLLATILSYDITSLTSVSTSLVFNCPSE